MSLRTLAVAEGEVAAVGVAVRITARVPLVGMSTETQAHRHRNAGLRS